MHGAVHPVTNSGDLARCAAQWPRDLSRLARLWQGQAVCPALQSIHTGF